MTLTHGFTNELKMLTENDTLGAVAGELLNVTLDRIGSSVNTPMYLSASFPTADSLLNIGPSLVASGDGAGKSVAPIGSTIPTTVLTTIDFQTGTVTGQTVTVDGGTFTLPTGTVSQYRRCVFVLRDDGSIDSSFSAESATISGLDNAGSLIAGLAITSLIPIGWVDLECDNSSGKYRTAGSSSSIIENKVGLDFRIVRSALLEDTGGAGFRVVRLHGGLILGSGGGDVSAEATARMNADSTLQANINAEITARRNADSTLQANIDSEVTALFNADGTLQANIDAEITARTNADITLQNNINIETTTRANADLTLQANINTEITARTSADNTEITARSHNPDPMSKRIL